MKTKKLLVELQEIERQVVKNPQACGEQVLKILLHDKKCKLLFENQNLQKHFKKVYHQSASCLAQELLSRSRYLFILLTEVDFRSVSIERNLERKEYNLMIDNVNDLCDLVTCSILQYKCLAGYLLAIDFWVCVARKCKELRDYNSMFAIHGALSSSAVSSAIVNYAATKGYDVTDFNQFINENINLLDKKNEFRLLELFKEDSVPLLATYKKMMVDNHARVNNEERIAKTNLLVQSLRDLQEENKKNNPKKVDLIDRKKLLPIIQELAGKMNNKTKSNLEWYVSFGKDANTISTYDDIFWDAAKKGRKNENFELIIQIQKIMKELRTKFPEQAVKGTLVSWTELFSSSASNMTAACAAAAAIVPESVSEPVLKSSSTKWIVGSLCIIPEPTVIKNPKVDVALREEIKTLNIITDQSIKSSPSTGRNRVLKEISDINQANISPISTENLDGLRRARRRSCCLSSSSTL